MDARCVEFVQAFGLEQMYRNLLVDLVRDLSKSPDYIGHQSDDTQRSKLIAEGAKELATAFAAMMEEKFTVPAHLDALLAFMKNESGRHAVFNLAFVFEGMAKPAREVSVRIFNSLVKIRR